MQGGDMRIAKRFIWGAVVLGLVSGVGATDIYRWVDENGRTHLSDVVPERYRDTAIRVDSRSPERTPEPQREARDRAAREASRLPPAVGRSPLPAEPATAPALAPAVKRPAQTVTAKTDCATWWRLYRESQDCFGPFRLVGGVIKPEAFEHCNEIPSPESRCGPYRH